MSITTRMKRGRNAQESVNCANILSRSSCPSSPVIVPQSNSPPSPSIPIPPPIPPSPCPSSSFPFSTCSLAPSGKLSIKLLI